MFEIMIFSKHLRAAAVLAGCGVLYLTLPESGAIPMAPADLRDAPNSGAALKDLTDARKADAPALILPEINMPDATEEAVPLKVLSAPRAEILTLARGYLQASLRSDYVRGDSGLSASYAALLGALNSSKIKLNETACKGRFEYYVAYINGEKDSLKIFLCERFSFLPAESVAQTVIHELSHVLLKTTEPQATRLETIATYLGGRTPELNGYNSEDFFEDLVSLNVETLKSRDLDYFFLMNARTPTAFRMLKLKTYAIYKNQSGVAYMLKRICAADEGCKLATARQKDQFGVSVLDNLSASGVKDPELFIRAAAPR